MNIGVIAEDYSDVDVLYELTSKLINSRDFCFKKFIGHGCGPIKRKCKAWAENLLRRGCDHLVVLHDLDTYSESKLCTELMGYVNNIGFSAHIILIPIYEIEAWLLADANALQKVFNMQRIPKIPHNPETITDPKEKLRDIIWKYTKRYYVNSIHNQKIANALAINKLNKKCRSFKPYPKFINKLKRTNC
jgi:hypothetical protein